MMNRRGFTIVELLIVIVVIAILAAVTIVAYNGIRERAITSSVQSGLTQANKKVLAYAAVNNDNYPATLADAGVANTSSVAYQYSVDNTATPRTYALTASNGPVGTTTFYLTSTQSTPTSGIAPGHNLIVWDKPQDSSSPVNSSAGVTIDTSVFRTNTASIRLAPSSPSKSLRNSPITGAVGQTVTVSLWILTDPVWDGSINNSKIRFGTTGGGIITACSYHGAKTTWTQVTCSFTLTSTYTTVTMSVGNDGTTGNIWLDDISVSIR